MTRLSGYFPLMFLALNMLIATAFAQQSTKLELKQGAPTTYTVVKGDTLWDISAMYLNNPWLWPQLWNINSDIENPHLIYPGDQLYLVWKNGQPQLMFKPKMTLSPQIHKVEKQPVMVVDKGLVLPYLQSDRLIEKTKLTQVSLVLGNNEGRQYTTKQDVLYFTGNHTHQNWGVYRLAQEFERDEQSMVALKLIATGKLVKSHEGISELDIKEQTQEVMQNDIVLPQVEVDSLKLTTTFFPHPAPKEAQSRILGGLDSGQYVAQSHIIVLDRGSEDGLKQGSMLEIYHNASSVYGSKGDFGYERGWFEKERKLPGNKVGELMVIRPYAKFSLALITSSQSAISRDAFAISPLADDSFQYHTDLKN